MSGFRSAAGVPDPHCQHQGITFAVRLVRTYGRRLPSVEELQNKFGVSRATAYRWRAALAEGHTGTEKEHSR